MTQLTAENELRRWYGELPITTIAVLKVARIYNPRTWMYMPGISVETVPFGAETEVCLPRKECINAQQALDYIADFRMWDPLIENELVAHRLRAVLDA